MENPTLSTHCPRDKRRGFTLVEMTAAIFFLSVGLLGLAGSLVSMSHQREQSEARSLVLAGAQALLEEIKCTPSLRDISVKYNNTTYTVKGVTGGESDGSAIRVTINWTNPKLVTVRLSGSWFAAGHTEHLELATEIYSYLGQQI